MSICWRAFPQASVLLITVTLAMASLTMVDVQAGTDFPGTVLKVDLKTGKFMVKKEGSGSRFTFVVNEKTKFEGAGLRGLEDLKRKDRVTVTYSTIGGKYIAEKVVAAPN